MKKTSLAILALAGASTLGCAFAARSPKTYSSDVEKLLETRKAEIKKCYDDILKKDKKAGGVVAVTFTVEPKTGVIKDPALDKKKTTASDEVSACLLNNMGGLKLDPPDQREGKGSFEYEFVGKPKK
jgi:hypothetical protein